MNYSSQPILASDARLATATSAAKLPQGGKFLERLLAAAWIMAVAGCAQQPVIEPDVSPLVELAEEAEARYDAGDFAGAARRYLELTATAAPAEARGYRALAVQSLLDSEDVEAARAAGATPLPAADANAATLALERLNRARLLFETDPAEARALLAVVDRVRLSPAAQLRALELEAQLAEQAGEWLTAARLRLRLDGGQLTRPIRTRNHTAIFEDLQKVDLTALQMLADAEDDVTSGWGNLALLARDFLHDAARFRQAFELWQTRWRAHPLMATIADDLLALSESYATVPARIALLLPFESPDAGQAAWADSIYDGFLTAWYLDAGNPDRATEIRRYAVGEGNAADVYARAVADGAEAVIGPLIRSEVEALSARDRLPVLTVALNEADLPRGRTTAPENLFQFGLLPEDEAREVARRARFDGHARAVILSAAGDEVAGREVGAFRDEWRQLGGEVVEAAAFAAPEFAQAVKLALNIDGSEQRRDALQDILAVPLVGGNERRRADVDFILFAGRPVGARQILPQLRFFLAESIPVYATSRAYSGSPNPALDVDLNGMIVGDMPWLVYQGPRTEFEGVSRDWLGDARVRDRLFAFGMDAYTLVKELGRMTIQQRARVDGMTGTLYLADGFRVKRELSWARFRAGVPEPIEPASTLQVSAHLGE